MSSTNSDGHLIDMTPFRSVLIHSFSSLPPESDNDPYFWDDWAQACWEMFVERSLPGWPALVPYGAGGDVHGASSRIIFQEALPTHAVAMTNEEGRVWDVLNEMWRDPHVLEFEEFVSFEGGWFHLRPPLDMAHCFLDDLDVVVRAPDVTFSARLL